MVCCCHSDEEENEQDVLMYLPVSPEIEEAEEGWPLEEVGNRHHVALSYAVGSPKYTLQKLHNQILKHHYVMQGNHCR